MLEEPRQPCPPGALTLPRGAHLLPEDTWAGWEAFPSHQMGGEWASRQGQFIHCRDVGQVGDCPSVCLSVCQEGSCTPGLLQCLIGGSLPSQLDEEEERRKRRREKNKVAAARCRNKKKERTEFLQRVSRAAGSISTQENSAWTCCRLP